jgi:hypothetical protein
MGNPDTTYWPRLLVTDVRTIPVWVFAMVIVTLGTRPPVGSVTVPTMVASWAARQVDVARTAAHKRTTRANHGQRAVKKVQTRDTNKDRIVLSHLRCFSAHRNAVQTLMPRDQVPRPATHHRELLVIAEASSSPGFGFRTLAELRSSPHCHRARESIAKLIKSVLDPNGVSAK